MLFQHGDVGRLNEVSNVSSTDDIMILRNGVLYRVAADFLPSGAENIVETAQSYNANGFEDIIFASGTITITLIDPADADKSVSIRNITGAASTITIATAAGTTEVSSLTNGQATRLAPYNSTTWATVT